MIDAMKRLLLALVLCLPLMATSPAVAQDDTPPTDARFEGYTQDVTIKGATTGLTWLLLVFLSTMTIAVLFKSGGRTHLD